MEPVLLSVGSNRTSQSLCWVHAHNVVCYAAGPFVAVYQPTSAPTVRLTLRLPSNSAASGDTDDATSGFRVNCIQAWSTSKSVYVAAGATDAAIHLFEVDARNWKYQYVKGLVGAHGRSVVALSVISCSESLVYFASAGGDAAISISCLDLSSSSWEQIAQAKLGSHGVQLAVELFSFQGTTFLAAGGVDAVLRLFKVNFQSGSLEILLKVQGHENWIRSIKFCDLRNGNSGIMASCDQDGYIRIWKLQMGSAVEQSEFNIDAELFSLGEHEHGFSVEGMEFSLFIDSVIESHEDWVCDLDWHPALQEEKSDPPSFSQPLKLLSASMDQTMSIWEPDPESGIWINEVHVGEVGGHSKLGFVNCKWGPLGSSIISSSFNGSLHHWKQFKEEEDTTWIPELSPSGHFDSVRDAAWDSSGAYLLTVSKDQTTRAFSRWNVGGTWNEIARPQVHGYDMFCLTPLPSTPFRFLSGAEEKVIRVFDAPISFLKLLRHLTGLAIDPSFESSHVVAKVTLPELGLSNKATENKEAADDDLSIDSPPLEEELLSSTLFPEVNKLYGHGYELYSLASNSKGTLVASACVAKTSQSEHASIIIWNTSSWKEVARLRGHTLTVVQMEFSHDDRYLLSVSRDRQFFVFDMNDMSVVCRNEKAHSRIIWSCSWSPDDTLFATGSRDKNVKVWSSKSWKQESALPQSPFAVTAVAFAPVVCTSQILAVGTEDGIISIFSQSKPGQWSVLTSLDPLHSHFGPINRLCWNRSVTSPKLLLASVGDDSSVRVFECDLPLL
eukprot:TRINITY_DN8690_c0_g1_i1.p1 TRINITY_DN8690_c0_g1~~TRINITY_DN8690_c0_g1_i1.p1  ORF type:complete len:796 (+),score=183.89 TRINITY_DN8690_c0_g1_i1:44-2389(+)